MTIQATKTPIGRPARARTTFDGGVPVVHSQTSVVTVGISAAAAMARTRHAASAPFHPCFDDTPLLASALAERRRRPTNIVGTTLSAAAP
jgi:hypothetical protein